jgi:adenylylsulfate kinase-like enzyme
VAIESPEEDARRYARSVSSEFSEIHLHATPEVLATRAGANGAVPFEPPVQPELRLDTGRLTLDEAGAEILAWIQEWSSQT